MVVRVKRHDTEKHHNFLTLLSLQFKNHAFQPSFILYCHPFQYSISISSSHNLQCLRTFHLFLDTAAKGDGVTESNCVAVTLLAPHVHASVRSPSCPISSPSSFRILNNSTKTRCGKPRGHDRSSKRPYPCSGRSVPTYTWKQRAECVLYCPHFKFIYISLEWISFRANRVCYHLP